MVNKTLDPDDWEEYRAQAHKMLDAAIDKMQGVNSGRVWTPLRDEMKYSFQEPLPMDGVGVEAVRQRAQDLLAYGVGNTHPRFFGWVHGAGSSSGLIADIAAAAMNANLGGRDHGAMYVEKQVVAWVKEMFSFPDEASGLVVSGTSMATIIALKVAREKALGLENRKSGNAANEAGALVGYCSNQAHACVARAFDILGLGSDALVQIPTNDVFEMDLVALQTAIDKDRAAGKKPFCVIGTAGSVNVGAIDDLSALADLARAENMWFHVDGAFGAAGVLSDHVRPRLGGLERADSIAFDFHKWLHVNYDAGFVLVRDGEAHRATFSNRPAYLKGAERGLAAGNPWPVEYGPELSRGFRALKIWAQISEHGTGKLGAAITRNCAQAAYLAGLVEAHSKLQLLAPAVTSVVCFRYIGGDDLNEEIVIRLQESGIAAPSITTLNGRSAIRVNITNHRTRFRDLDLLVDEVVRAGAEFKSKFAG